MEDAPIPLSFPSELNIPCIFPFTSTLDPPPTSPFLLQPQQDDHIGAEDIDWESLFSGGSSVGQSSGEQKPPSPGGSATGRDNAKGKGGEGDVGASSKDDNTCKARRPRKAIPPRIAFQTRSADDVLDDGYKWRKYGQKAVKNSVHPRSYYRCTHHTCGVKKQIQRLSKDTSIVVTTYEGIHNHPCEKLMETLSPLLRQIQFLSRF